MTTKTTSYTVLVVDDHPLFRKGASQLLSLDERFELVGEATSGGEGVTLASELQPDLILLDMNMSDMDGVKTLKAMRDAGISGKIVMLTVSNAQKDLAATIKQGADGYLLKDMEPEDILESLCKAMVGKIPISEEMTHLLIDVIRDDDTPDLDDVSLTDREQEILSLIAKGKNNKLIARELDISEGTVKVHVKNILRKLKLTSRLEAAVWAIDHGFNQ